MISSIKVTPLSPRVPGRFSPHLQFVKEREKKTGPIDRSAVEIHVRGRKSRGRLAREREKNERERKEREAFQNEIIYTGGSSMGSPTDLQTETTTLETSVGGLLEYRSN